MRVTLSALTQSRVTLKLITVLLRVVRVITCGYRSIKNPRLQRATFYVAMIPSCFILQTCWIYVHLVCRTFSFDRIIGGEVSQSNRGFRYRNQSQYRRYVTRKRSIPRVNLGLQFAVAICQPSWIYDSDTRKKSVSLFYQDIAGLV